MWEQQFKHYIIEGTKMTLTKYFAMEIRLDVYWNINDNKIDIQNYKHFMVAK